MDEEQKPSILANRIILQLIQHMVSDQLRPSWEDFASIRVVYRQCGGTWLGLIDGDLRQVELLKTIVTAWGQMPIRQLELKRVI
jgi:hypothetical protein